METLEKIYWGRVLLGAIVGVFCGILSKTPFLSYSYLVGPIGVIVAIVVYWISYQIVRMKCNKSKIGRKTWLEGIGSYFISWFFFWSLILNF